ELLVDGHDLFVGDAPLLIGALQVLDAALQVLTRRFELVLELVDDRLVPLARRARDVRHRRHDLRLVDERDEQESLDLARPTEWLDREPDPVPSVVAPNES